MNQKFQSSIQQKDGMTFLKLSGVIDEDNELFDLSDRTGGGTVIIDLAEIERINSCGVRDWVNWLARLEKKDSDVILVECSPAIVAQINLVNNFTGKGRVKSFYAPYFCPSCDLEKVLLVELEEMKSMDVPKAPTCRCDECDGVMDFDDMEDSYFAFVATAEGSSFDPEISRAVKDMTGTENGSGGRKVKSRSKPGTFTGGGSSKGGSRPGSHISSISLPSLPSVPSLPSLPSLTGVSKDINGEGGDKNSNAGAMGGKSNLALILVMILLLVAIGLLVYVIFTGQGRSSLMTSNTDSIVDLSGQSSSPFL